MSLLDDNFIEVNLYYKYVKTDNGKKLVILSDEKGKELYGKEGNEDIEMLSTKWCLLNWQEQNEVMSVSSQTVNPQTGEKQFNFLIYRDSIIKKCLKKWNLTSNEKPVPVTPDAINKLPGPVVSNLYQKFEKLVDYTEQELGN